MGKPVYGNAYYLLLIGGALCLGLGIYYIVLAVEQPDEAMYTVLGSVLSLLGILLLSTFAHAAWTSKPKAKPKAKSAAPAQNLRY
jgi:hypothetical protein